LLQADDRVPTVRVLAAGSANASNHDFAVARYWRWSLGAGGQPTP